MTLRRLIASASLATALLAPIVVAAQAVEKQRPTSTPYVGDFGIFEEKDRDTKLQIDRVMDVLHITPGKTVADIGAGGGWFTVRAARRVGPQGRVYGEDINPEAAKAIDARAAKEHLPQAKAVLGAPDDPKLPASSVDAVLLLKVYHEIAEPIPFMQRLRASLAPGARVGIIDHNGNGTDHGIKQSVVETEMREAGFREIEHNDFTKTYENDYFLVFVAR